MPDINGMLFATTYKRLDVMFHHNTVLDVTPGKTAVLTSFGGALSFVQGLIATGQLVDAFFLGLAGALGALVVTLVVGGLKRTKPWWSRLWKWFKKIW